MTHTELLFDKEDAFDVVNVIKNDCSFVVTAHSKINCSLCPRCNVASNKLHSYYWRNVMDLSMLNSQTRIRLKARKFYCKNTACDKKIFSEQFIAHFRRYKRITTRVENKLLEIAQQSGGNGGEKLCQLMNIPVSSSTLIRFIHHHPVKEISAPRILGIDDWAYTKRLNYGTILVDLEKRKVIDLLPDRETETVEKWLKAHPGVEIITRDRFSNFANGVKQASDSIVQIADRWHLLCNLTEVIKKMLVRNNHYLKETREDEIRKDVDDDILLQEAYKKAQFEDRSLFHKKFTEAKRLISLGYSNVQIRRILSIDRRTIIKWRNLDEVPRRRKAVKTNIAQYEDQVIQILLENPGISIYQIWLTIKGRGYNGGQVTAYKQIGRIKGRKHKYIPKQASTFWQPSTTSLLICKKPEQLTAREREMIRCLCRRSREIKKVVQLARGFRKIMKNKDGGALESWIKRAMASEIKEIKGFAKGMLGDLEAIQNAMSLPWSNGQVEGQVNKLKTIKRQMYGRASFSLLRKRLIYESA